jgi:ClpX C4-type zinc finger protein
MKNQFHINVLGKEELIIDLNENELVSINISNNPYATKQDNPVKSMCITGNRWHEDEMDILEWKAIELSSGDKISIEINESDIKPSTIYRDDLYVRPEEECSFCMKKESEVKHLIASKIHSNICNECISTCMDLINEKDNT